MCLFFSFRQHLDEPAAKQLGESHRRAETPGSRQGLGRRAANLLSRVFRSQHLAARSLAFFAIPLNQPTLKVDLACVRGTFFFVRASIANTSEGICGFVSRHLKSAANGPRGVFEWICIECNIKWRYYVVTLGSVVNVFYSFPAVQIEISKKKKKKDWCRTTNTRLFCAGNTCLTRSSPAHRCWRKNNMTAFFIY